MKATIIPGNDFGALAAGPNGSVQFPASGDGEVTSLLTKCPGCGAISALPVKPWRNRPHWDWNGDRDKPTLNPSVHHIEGGREGEDQKCGWHGWLRNGEWVSV